MKSVFFNIIILVSTVSFCQENDDFAKRLKAIYNQTTIFYNTDGVDFSSQIFSTEFSEIEISLIEKGKDDIEQNRLIPHEEAKEKIKNYIKSKSL